MRRICLDQGAFRSEALAEIIAEEPDSVFVICNTALFEMSKSKNHWRSTVAQSFRILSSVPDRVVCTRGVGQCIEEEVQHSRPISFETLVCGASTRLIREMLREVASGTQAAAFAEFERTIEPMRALMQAKFLDHEANKGLALASSDRLKSMLPKTLLKAMRANEIDEADLRKVLSLLAMIHVIGFASRQVQSPMEWKAAASMLEHCSFVFRLTWLRLWKTAHWLALSGLSEIKPIKITNSAMDAHYVVFASYCDDILTQDIEVQKHAAELRNLVLVDSVAAEQAVPVFAKYFGEIALGEMVRCFHPGELGATNI